MSMIERVRKWGYEFDSQQKGGELGTAVHFFWKYENNYQTNTMMNTLCCGKDYFALGFSLINWERVFVDVLCSLDIYMYYVM